RKQAENRENKRFPTALGGSCLLENLSGLIARKFPGVLAPWLPSLQAVRYELSTASYLPDT
ncbi:MAG: hypothetical protein OET63_19390, partial [Desulfobacterales bacterium]|nr:hypothetical protein [Desulfobacterales bacterium]